MLQDIETQTLIQEQGVEGFTAHVRQKEAGKPWQICQAQRHRNGALCPKLRENKERTGILSLAAKYLQFVSHFNGICWVTRGFSQVWSY